MTEQQVEDTLLAAYQAEVEFRHREFVMNDSIRSYIRQLSQFFTSDGKKFGLMFCGVCGNGKTTLLYALQSAINYLRNCGVLEDKKIGISIVDAKEVAQYAKDINRFKELKSREMLAIEDMGREPTEVIDFGNVLNPVVDLLEYRYNNQLFTAITTNLEAKQISTKYGKRIADRFNEMLEVIVFKNATYRK